MSQLNNPLDIYKLLPKSNCRQCRLPTCLAFAAAVIQGQKRLKECPCLEKTLIEQLEGQIVRQKSQEDQLEQTLAQLKEKIAGVDFLSAEQRLGASLSGGKLTLRCLGKNFTVDSRGNITSDCHVITWITIPLLNYILFCPGREASGEWVSFRELKGGTRFSPLYDQRCEKPLKQFADTRTELFEDVLHIFGGKPAPEKFSADISLVLHPLPRVPVLISYSKPENNFQSKFNILFDTSVEENLGIDWVYMLMGGMVRMFEKIASRHG
ncbi:MAG: DUF3786 domain-containing protein [Bacillota bacterium]